MPNETIFPKSPWNTAINALNAPIPEKIKTTVLAQDFSCHKFLPTKKISIAIPSKRIPTTMNKPALINASQGI